MLHLYVDAERYREWTAQLAVWLEDEDEVEEDSPPPSDSGCNDGCKHGCNSGCKGGCKEIEGDDSPQTGESSRNGDDIAKIDDDDPGSFATNSGSHNSLDPAPLEEPHDRLNGRSALCVSEIVANEKIENDGSSTYRKISSVSMSKSPHVVCNHACNPVCNPVENVANVANRVRPMLGMLDPRTFARVRVEIGRCDVCGAAKAVYRSREAQAKICEWCYSRLAREGNARVGVR